MNFLNYFFLIFNLITISITQPNVDFYNTGVNNYENHQIPTNIVSSYNTYSTNQNPSVYPEIREYDFSKLFQNSNFNTIPSSASSYYSSSPQGNNKNSFAETNTIEDLPSINTANLASQDPNVLAQYLKYVESVHNVENDNLKGISSQNPYLSTLLQGNSQVNLPEQPLTQYATNLKIPESAYQTSNVLPSSGYSVSSQSNVNFPSSSSYTLPNSYSQQEKMTYISPSSEKLPSDYSKNTKTSYNMEYNIQPGYNGYSVNQPTPVNNPSIYSGQETNSRQVVSSNLPYQNTVNSPYTIPQGYVNQPSIVPSSYSETPSTVQKPYEIPNTINGYTNNKVSQPTSLYTSNGQYNINNEVSSYTSSNVPVGLPPAPKTYTYVPPQKPTAAPQVQITPAPIYPSNKYSINPSNYNVPVASQSTNYNYQNIGIRQPTNVQPVVYPNNNAYTNIQSTNNQQINNGYPQAIQQPTQQIIQTTQSPIQIQTSLPIKETNIYNMESSLYNTKDTNINQGYSNNVVSNYVKSTEKEDNFYVPDDQKSIYENVEEDNYEKTNSLPSQGSSYRNSSEVSENNNDISSQTSIAALTQQIKRLPAVFYADSTDSNTQRIEHMLRDTYGLPLVTFYLDKIDDTNTVEKNLQTLTAHTGSPYLFICGTFIGSQQHIDNYNDNKQIPQLVEYVCGDQKHRHRSKRHDTTISFPKVEWKKISSK